MNKVMNDYVSNIQLKADDMTKNLLISAISTQTNVEQYNVMSKNNKFIIEIQLSEYNTNFATSAMNQFMEASRYPYSSNYLRFNEGDIIRYRYATCKEDKQGYYCDIVIKESKK